jgi:hypothetical protein
VSDLTLICQTCSFPIQGDTGSLYVRLGEVTAAQAARADWEERHPSGTAIDITELLTHPEDVRWRSAHDKCRDDRDQGCYEIDVPRIATWSALCRWTAHLMEKNWFDLSDWDSLLREVSGDSPSSRIQVAAREAA